MLDTLRQHSKSALIYVFFAIIIVVFVFSFGPGSSGCQGRSGSVETFAAKVNGETITYQDFMALYSRMFRDYQNRGGGQFNEEMARAIKLKDRVLDQMIDKELLAQAALKSGVAVSDKELAESLRKTFAPDGKFDEKAYRQILEYQLNTTTWQFEEQERRRLAAQKMIASVAASAKVSDEEVRAEYSREKEKLDVTYVRFAPASFKAEVPRPDDAAAEAYAKANPAKIEQAYKANQARFTKPERVRASHILIKLDEKATDAQADEAKKKILEVKAKIVAGADFATEAKAISEDPGSKESGGDLGAFGRGSMVPPFEQAAFALKAGELSEPVRTKFGYHLIKVAEVLPAENKSLEAASKELAIEAIIEEGAKALAQKKADETLAQAKEGKKLEEIWPPEEKKEPQQPGMLRFDVGGAKPAAAVTGPFSPANDYIPQIGVDAALSRALLSLDEKKPLVEKAYEVNGSFYVVALKAHERADFKELEAKMDEYREKARQKKVNEGLESFLKGLKDQAKIEKNDALLYGSAPAGAVAFDG